MVTKKLVKDITTFHNTFINIKGITASITVFNGSTFFISVNIKLWTFNDCGLEDVIMGVSDNIHNYKDFEIYKENVRNKIVPLLNK